MAEPQVAVLVDLENVGAGSLRWMLDQASEAGRIIVKRAYGDWSKAAVNQEQILEYGVEQIHVSRSPGGGKNSSDIRLAIDAVDLLHQSPVDTFVIVSSDTDFVPLVSKLRAAGKTVIGAGRRAAASRFLVSSCDRYIYLEEAEEAHPRPEPSSLLLRAVKASIDDEGKVTGSKLHQTIQRLDPSFSFRAFGHSTFTRFLQASPGVRVTRPKRGWDVVVELVEQGAQPVPQPPQPPVPPVRREVEQPARRDVEKEWEPKIDAAWARKAAKPGDSIPGPNAAAEAAKAIGVTKLSASPYKTLQKLLDASSYLSARWERKGNRIARRQG